MTQDYYGTKRITAWPERKPFPIDPADLSKGQVLVKGYAVKYGDGYISWSPKDVFEAAYQPLNALSFGHAIEALKAGHRVARAGWNGKGMWLEIVPPSRWSTSVGPSGVPNAHRLPWIGMKTADGGFVPWLASRSLRLGNSSKMVASASPPGVWRRMSIGTSSAVSRSARSTFTAFGAICMPAPTRANAGACSYTRTAKPRRNSKAAVARPTKKAAAVKPRGAKSAPRSAVKTPRVAPGELVTLLDFLRYAVSRFAEAGVVFAHGTTDPIAEAVFLSTRVVVMSARPGRIADIVTVDLPQPRTGELREDRRYFDLVTEVRESLARGGADLAEPDLTRGAGE